MATNEEKLENTPAGGALVGKKDGQTIIHDKGTMSGYLVGKLHKDGGIQAVNKATGQPLEMQGGEVVITAPAVADQTKREFEGKMMTNREILSKINSDGGGVSFADGGDIPAKIHTTDCEYKFDGNMVKDTDIAHSLGMNSTLKKGKQYFSLDGKNYDVDGIYNAIKKGKLRLKTKEVETFPMKYSVYDKNYAENHKIDFRKPNGITVRTESGEEILIDGNHRMNDAYLKGKKTMKTYYIEDPKQISKFIKKANFEMGGENKKGGHLSKGKSLKQIAEMHNVSLSHINEQLAKGLEVEKEYFSDFAERTRVTKDHLVENPNYYTILAKAGLKRGGKIDKQDLVKDAEDGNTPARDLNNYNDILDIQADGMVGAENGLAFADGGELNNEPKEGDLITNFGKYGVSIIDVDDNYVYWLDQYASKNYCKKSDLSLNNLDDDGDSDGYYQDERNNWICNKSYSNGGVTPYDANLDGDSVDIIEEEFAKGGVVYDTTKPKIEKITIIATGDSSNNRVNVIGRNASNVSELQQIVSDYIGNYPKQAYDYIGFSFNDNAGGKYYIQLNKDKKNSVKNVNPETLNSVNFKRVIDNKTYLVKNYDWTDFFEGASNKPAPKGKPVDKVSVIYFDVDGKTKVSQETGNPIQIYNFLKKLYNDGSRYAELQPLGHLVSAKPESINITNGNWRDILFSKPEKEAVEAIINILEVSLFPKLDFSKFNKRYNPLASVNSSNQNEISKFTVSTDVSAGIEVNNIDELYDALYDLKDYDTTIYLKYKDSEGKNKSFGAYFRKNPTEYYQLDKDNFNVYYLKEKLENWFNNKVSKSFFDIITQKHTSSKPIIEAFNLELVYPNGRIEVVPTINVSMLKNALANFWNIVDKKSWQVRVTPFESQFSSFRDEKFIIGDDFSEYNPEDFSEEQLGNMLKVLYPDLDLSYFLKEGKNKKSNQSVSAKPLITDLTNTKINVKGNPDLSLAVQKRAFELGWEWENGGGKTYDYNSFNYMYFTKTSISQGNTDSSFINSPKKEIFADDLFTSATPKHSNQNQPNKKEVEKVELIFNSNKSVCNNAVEFYDALMEIENESQGLNNNIQINVFGRVKNVNSLFAEGRLIKIGKGYFQPSKLGNPDNLKNVAENWFNKEVSFDDFFEKITQNQSVTNIDVTSVYITDTNGEVYSVNSVYELFIELEKIWNRYRKQSTFVTIQPAYISTVLSQPIALYLEKNRRSNSFDLDEMSMIEFKNKLKELFPNFDFTYFFKANKDIIVDSVNLSYGSGVNATYYTDLKSGQELFDVLSNIERKTDKWKAVIITANFFEDGIRNSIKEDMVVVKKGENSGRKDEFCPSVASSSVAKSSLELLQEFLEDNIFVTVGLNFDKFFEVPNHNASSVSNSNKVEGITDLKEIVSTLEGIASQASLKYNTNKYEENLELLKEVKEEYALALSFTPESSYMYERIELMKKIAEIQKEITRITELKKGGAFYILSKVVERLEKGENWQELGKGEIIINEVPQQEIDTVIYTEKFKNWFGDWEQALITKDYDYVSKAITKSGKPCVMYHGAKRIKFSYRQVSNGVVYLAENRSYAEWFSTNESPYQKQGDYLTQCFVNLKNPIDLTPFGVEEVDLRDIIQYIDALYPLAKIYDVLPPNTAMAIMNNQLIGRNFRAWYIIRQFPELNKHIRDNTTYDGFIYYENNPSDLIRTESGELVENVTKATAVFNSNQVKLVDAMLFDSSLDDWRFETGGKVN